MFSSAMRWARKRCSGNNAGRISPRVLLFATLGALVLWGVTSAVTAGSPDPNGLIAAPTTASRLPPSSTSVDLRPSVPGVAVVGSTAPPFFVPNLRSGDRVGVGISNAAPTLLNFWASWCIPCREEFPELKSIRKQYSLEELSMVGITFKDTRRDALQFADSEGANWQLGFDAKGTVAKDYGVRAAPQTFLIDKSGVIIRRWYGRPNTSELNLAVEGLVRGI
ncbi:MAG: redoxin domain-containing protein [Actinobacteria bacterium]|nr:redoxin domain-containing protein [Actinomycetota bacterium]